MNDCCRDSQAFPRPREAALLQFDAWEQKNKGCRQSEFRVEKEATSLRVAFLLGHLLTLYPR